MDFSFKFPAVKGIQAGKEYYVAMVPLKLLDRLFGNDDEYVPPEFRAQRRLNTARIPVIKDYILTNRESYVFSAIAASIDGEYYFRAIAGDVNLGTLEVSMDAHFMIVDGQHRKASIIEALIEDESLRDETISIVLYEDEGLENSQQMFTDLNKHAVKTSNSISELYDSRDELAGITRRVINEIPFLNQYTDKEKDILGKYSSNFFTLNTFYKANKKVLGHCEHTGENEGFLLRYWTAVATHILPWKELSNKEISKVDLREQYIVTQAIIIQSFGILGNYYLANPEHKMESSISKLEDINWQRSAACWRGRVVSTSGKIINSFNAAKLACNYIKKSIELPLSKEEQVLEKAFNEEK